MARTFTSPHHEILRAFLIEKRKKAGLRQVDVAKRLKRYQSYVTHIETGQKEIGFLEFLDLAEAIGFDPQEAIRVLKRAGK